MAAGLTGGIDQVVERAGQVLHNCHPSDLTRLARPGVRMDNKHQGEVAEV